MSSFTGLQIAPPNPIFQLRRYFEADDKHPQKIDLGIGEYRDESGQCNVLDVVKESGKILDQKITDGAVDHRYLPIAGLPSLIKTARKLVLGTSSPGVAQKRVRGLQTVSGTGALRLAAEFLYGFYPKDYKAERSARLKACHDHSDPGCTCHDRDVRPGVYISDPTWANHRAIFEYAGFTVGTYRYQDRSNNTLNFDGMIEDLSQIPEQSIVVIQPCAHNPTGIDPTQTQWKHIIRTCKKRQLFVVFDIAYQGLASGDLDQDAWAVRHADSENLNFFVCQSFSKNFGLYNERVGCLTIAANNQQEAKAILSQMEVLVRINYSNPPHYGARIVAQILEDEELRSKWKSTVKRMGLRIVSMRRLLHDALLRHGIEWPHLLEQKGMFSMTGLDSEQVQSLRRDFGIFLLDNGRITVCAITPSNVEYLAAALARTIQGQ